MRAIAAARAWARSNGFSLEARMATGSGLEVREVESLSHALKAAQVPNRTARPLHANILPLSGSGKEAHRRLSHDHDEMLEPQTGANRVRFVAAYLEWLASHSRAVGSQHLLRDTIKALNARAKAGTRQPAEPRKGLSPEQRDRLFAVIDPSSPDNPFRSEAVRYRNLAVVACLDQTGMRRGELSGLKIPDIDFGKLRISIHRRPPDPRDPRQEKPKTKTGARPVPIRPELAGHPLCLPLGLAAGRTRCPDAWLCLRLARGAQAGRAVEPEKRGQDLRCSRTGSRLRSPSAHTAPHLERQVLGRDRSQDGAWRSHPRGERGAYPQLSDGMESRFEDGGGLHAPSRRTGGRGRPERHAPRIVRG